jgi:hypothetical protein
MILFFIWHSLTASGEIGRDWTQVTSGAAWGPRTYHKAVSYNGKMWVMGGHLGADDLADVWYSVDGKRWTLARQTGLATLGSEYAAVAFNGKIWTLGADERMVCYSTDGKTWTRVLPDPPWLPRSCPAAVVHDGKIWVLGGFNLLRSPPVYYNDVWCSSDGLHWTSVTGRAEWPPLAGHQALSFDGKLWVIGGHYHFNGYDGDSPMTWFSDDGRRWRLATKGAPWGYRVGFGAAVADRRIWVISGAIVDSYGYIVQILSDVLSSTDGANWRYATTAAPWLPRLGHAVVVYNQRLWILGGRNYYFDGSGWHSTPLNDVWYSPIPAGVRTWQSYP